MIFFIESAHAGPPPDSFEAYISESSVPCVLAMYYTLQVARNKDKVALNRVLGTLAVGHNDRTFEDPFLHTLVSFLSFFLLFFFLARLFILMS